MCTMYIYIYMHICIYACIYTYIYIYIYVYAYIITCKVPPGFGNTAERRAHMAQTSVAEGGMISFSIERLALDATCGSLGLLANLSSCCAQEADAHMMGPFRRRHWYPQLGVAADCGHCSALHCRVARDLWCHGCKGRGP